jgi:hypothetical protein
MNENNRREPTNMQMLSKDEINALREYVRTYDNICYRTVLNSEPEYARTYGYEDIRVTVAELSNDMIITCHNTVYEIPSRGEIRYFPGFHVPCNELVRKLLASI